MSGAHRQLSGRPVTGVLKSLRWLAALLAVVLGIAALLGLIIYGLVVGTDLEVSGFIGLFWIVMLAMLFVRRKREDAWFRWFGVSILLTEGWHAVLAFAHHQHWPTGQVRLLTLIGHGISLVAVVCIGVAVVIRIRSGRLGWLRRTAAPR